MIVFMVFAAGIRFWKLGAWSFWADEVFLIQDAQRFPGEITINPIMYMIVRFLTDTFGMSEWSARLGPCIIGILSIPLLYWFAKRIFNAQVGMIACAFLVVLPWHIYWSQNAKAYSLSFLFAGLSACLFYLALERDRVGLVIASLFFAVLSICSYTQSVMLLPAFAAYVVLLIFFPVNIPRGLNEKNLLVFFGLFILSFLLLFSPSIRDYLFSGWGSNEWGRSPLYILFTLVFCLGIPISVASFVGGIHSLIYMNRGGLFLVCYAAIPLLLLLIISPFLNVAGYYLFFTVPAYLLLSAFCASELTKIASRKSRILSAAVILIVLIASLSQVYLYFAVENGGRPKWREAFQTVEHRIGIDDTVVVSTPRIAEYYLWESSGKAASAGPKDTSHPQAMELKDVIAQLGTLEGQWNWKNQHVWFVLDQPHLNVLDADNRFREWLYAKCRIVAEFPVYARVMDRTISVWHLEPSSNKMPYVPMDLPDEFYESPTF